MRRLPTVRRPNQCLRRRSKRRHHQSPVNNFNLEKPTSSPAHTKSQPAMAAMNKPGAGPVPANAGNPTSPGPVGPGPVGPMPQSNSNVATGRGNPGPGGQAVNANLNAYGNNNLNNSIMDNSNLNLLDQSRNNASQPPVYDYGRNFNNSSFCSSF